MPAGFYCTVQRVVQRDGVMSTRTGWLLGPYGDEPTARAMLPDARRLAYEADHRTHFDTFGTARLEQAGDLPQGILNDRLEPGELSEAF